MATKKVKKVDAASTPRKDEAITLREEYRDYMLMDALDGDFDLEMDTRAEAAFAMSDVETLRVLCKKRMCPIDFVEPSDVLPGEAKKMKPIKLTKGTRPFTVEDFTPSERLAILSVHPGTRLYARLQYEIQAGNPFDES